MPTVIVYGRASRDPKEQRISVDRQLKLCTAYAQDRWPDATVQTFRDDNLSAADPEVHRPGYTAFLTALRAAKRGEVVAVVVNEQSRLTRQAAQWDALVIALRRAGIEKVDTLRGGPVSVMEGSSLVGRILNLVDADEAERTKARVRQAHADLFTEGRPAGRAPYGFAKVRDDHGRAALAPHPEQAPIVVSMFARALRGDALVSIADDLNASGVPSPTATWKRARPWTAATVRGVLAAPSVAGLRGHTDDEGKLHTVPATWAGIVSVDDWERARHLIGGARTVRAANGNTYRVGSTAKRGPMRRYLLTGNVLHCGKCGALLSAQTQTRRGQRVPAYQCHPKNWREGSPEPRPCGGVSMGPADEVEAEVVRWVQAAVQSRRVQRLLAAGHDRDAQRLRRERDDAKATMVDAAQLRGEGVLDRDAFTAMHNAAKARHDHATAQLAALTTDDVELPTADDIAHRWDGLSLSQQRAVVERLIDRVDVAPASGPRAFNPDRLGHYDDAGRFHPGKPVWRA